MPESRLLRTGEMFRQYRIDHPIAQGPTADIYRAVDTSRDEPVALKIMAKQIANESEWRKRFRHECDVAGVLRHPHIVRALEWGEDRADDGSRSLYLTMDYVDSHGYRRPDVRTLLNSRGELDPRTAIRLLRPVAEALAAAHRHGLIHCDVRPGNILIERRDGPFEESHVYLADFGFSTKTHEVPTLSNTRIGTAHYASPEQLEGNREVLPSTDVYALACVAFEMMSLRRPYYEYGTHEDMHEALVSGTVSIPSLLERSTQRLPKAIDTVMANALAKDPVVRTSSPIEFVTQLEQALEPLPLSLDPPPPDPPPLPWWREHLSLVVSAALLTVVVPLVVALWSLAKDTSSYDGQLPEAPFAFRYPDEWSGHTESGRFVVFSPLDVRDLFTRRQNGWDDVVAQLRDDPTRVIGLYVSKDSSGIALADTRGLKDRLGLAMGKAPYDQHTTSTPGSRVSWMGDGVDKKLDAHEARIFTGVVRPPDSTDPVQIRAVAVELDSSTTMAYLIFFAAGLPAGESVFDQELPIFQDLLNTVDLSP